MALRAHSGGRVLAHLDHFGGVDNLQQVCYLARVALLPQGFADLGCASDELDLVAPGACRADGARHWSLRRLIAAHCIQRDANHEASQALFTKRLWGCWTTC